MKINPWNLTGFAKAKFPHATSQECRPGGFTLTSEDGIQWSVNNSGTTESISGLAYGNGRFVAVAATSTVLVTNTILVSTNGVDWSLVDGGVGASWLKRVHYALGTFVAVGAGGIVLSSTDGMTWVSRDPGVGNPLNGVAFANGTFVVVGDEGAILQSAQVPLPVLVLGPIVVSPQGAIGITLTGPPDSYWTLQSSTNLADWQTIAHFFSTNSAAQIADVGATNANQRFYRGLSSPVD